MSWKCDIVMDLLPLYHDKIASEASRRLVREHLKECPECRAYYRRYRPAEGLQVEFSAEFPKKFPAEEFTLLAKRMWMRRVLLFVGFLSYVCTTLAMILFYFFRQMGICRKGGSVR